MYTWRYINFNTLRYINFCTWLYIDFYTWCYIHFHTWRYIDFISIFIHALYQFLYMALYHCHFWRENIRFLPYTCVYVALLKASFHNVSQKSVNHWWLIDFNAWSYFTATTNTCSNFMVNKANSTNLYPPTKGYLRETCKSQNINPIYLTLSSPTVSFRS